MKPTTPRGLPFPSGKGPGVRSTPSRRRGDTILLAAVIVAVAGIIVIGLSMGLDDRFIYHPLPFDERAAHALLGGLSVEEHSFPTTDDLRLHGWIARTDPAAPWLLWCHGNAGNISHRADNLALLVEHGLNVFIFDYRGYGRSEGRPSEPGFYADAAAAYDYLRSTAGVTPAQIVLYGRSLGAPVAAELALRRPAAGLILEAPLGSITAMARTVIPLVPLEKLFRARFDTLARAPRLQLPTLVMVAERDDVIPPQQARQIFAALPGPKEIWTIPGAHHNNTYVAGGTAYFEQMTGFIRRVTATTGT